ncbi:hypothetical protein C8R45DRAFT_1166632 [Mycena sanguinolenta]|nr:hypothetical protein C8R45DRAFT_1166632 [Mycena sanguinolenta]
MLLTLAGAAPAVFFEFFSSVRSRALSRKERDELQKKRKREAGAGRRAQVTARVRTLTRASPRTSRVQHRSRRTSCRNSVSPPRSAPPARQPAHAQRNETKRNKLESGPGNDADEDAEYFKISCTVEGVRRSYNRRHRGAKENRGSSKEDREGRKVFEDDDEELARRSMISEVKDRKRTIVEESLNSKGSSGENQSEHCMDIIQRRTQLSTVTTTPPKSRQEPRPNASGTAIPGLDPASVQEVDDGAAPLLSIVGKVVTNAETDDALPDVEDVRESGGTTTIPWSAMESLSWWSGWNWELGGPRGNREAGIHMGRDAKREDELDAAREITPPRRQCTSPANPPTSPQYRAHVALLSLNIERARREGRLAGSNSSVQRSERVRTREPKLFLARKIKQSNVRKKPLTEVRYLDARHRHMVGILRPFRKPRISSPGSALSAFKEAFSQEPADSATPLSPSQWLKRCLGDAA